MSVLPAGQPLLRLLPDLDELLHDPAGYLAAGHVTIGPRRMYRLAALFGFTGAAFLAGWLGTGRGEGELLALGFWLLLGASVWLGWSLLLNGHELVLHPDGVEVKYRDTAVWCPWALFNVEGNPFVPDADSPLVGLTLPVAPEAIPYVELRRDDRPVAHGSQVKARQVMFTSAREVVLPARYEVVAEELGALLLQLGRRLGRRLPKEPPLADGSNLDELEPTAPVPDAAGWIKVHLTRITLPPECAGCHGVATSELRVVTQARGDWLLAAFTRNLRPLELSVPVCDACHEEVRRRQQRGGMIGMSMGAVLGAGSVMLLSLAPGANGMGGQWLVTALALVAGALVGFVVGTAVGRRAPVQVRRYSPGRGTLELRFRNPEYAARVLDAMKRMRD
jgi:hypothetical protein